MVDFSLYFVYQDNSLFIIIYLPVIVLDDITHCPDSRQVFIIALWVDVMEGLGIAGIPIGACEINSNLAGDKYREDQIR